LCFSAGYYGREKIMKLYGTPISPFTRKAMIVAHELELKLEILPRPDDATEFRRINPLGKIPALVLNDGSVLIDSPVICEYLNDLGKGGLFPASGSGRWQALGLQALADGVADAAVARVVEGRQPAPNQARIVHHMAAVDAGLDALEQTHFTDPATIGEIAAACAIGYIDYRLPDMGWRAARPKLAAWYERFAACKSMQATQPE
jgi:glutathione S-transferase